MPKLKIYSTATCAFCHAEKQFLDEKGFKYESAMVDSDPAALAEMNKLSDMNAVPFNVITDDSGEVIDKFPGFDQARLVEKLGLS